MLELTFNFPRPLSILTFSKNELTIFTKKNQKKRKKKEKEKLLFVPLYLKSQSRMTL